MLPALILQNHFAEWMGVWLAVGASGARVPYSATSRAVRGRRQKLLTAVERLRATREAFLAVSASNQT